MIVYVVQLKDMELEPMEISDTGAVGYESSAPQIRPTLRLILREGGKTGICLARTLL